MADTLQLRTALKRSLVGSGVSQREVAQKMGVGDDLLSRYLSGNRKLPDNFAADFVKALDAARTEKADRLMGRQITATAAGAAR